MTNKLLLILFSISYLFSFQSSIEERLYSLNRALMCPVCDGLTLEQSQAGPALEMKEEMIFFLDVRDVITAGYVTSLSPPGISKKIPVQLLFTCILQLNQVHHCKGTPSLEVIES